MRNNIEKILNLKHQEKTNSQVANKLNISERMVEKVLQLDRLQSILKEILSNERYDKLLSLNYKALKLKLYIDNIDFLNLLLDSIDNKATEKDIKEKISLLEIRQEKIKEIQKDIDYYKTNLAEIQKEINEIDADYKSRMKEVDQKFKFIINDEKLSDTKKESLLECIAYNKKYDNWVFVGFISNKNQYFKIKKEFLEEFTFGGWDLPPKIINIEKLVEFVKRTRLFNAEFQTKYTNSKNLVWSSKMDKSQTYLKEIKEKKEKLNKQAKEFNKKLKEIEKANIYDYMAVLEAKNELAEKDIINHNRVSIMAMEWLKNNNYIADIEYSYENYRFDVIGVKLETNEVVIVETKVNINDYKQDKKKYNYLNYCDKMYVVTDKWDIKHHVEYDDNDIFSDDVGILIVEDNKIKLIRESNIKSGESVLDKNKIVKNIYNKYWTRIYKIGK